jgi:S-adenosyl methyltransferase
MISEYEHAGPSNHSRVLVTAKETPQETRNRALTYYRPAWAPDSIDIEKPSAARMYDYYLGGSHNFAADRQLAEEAKSVFPDTREYCVANRAFLQRSVAALARLGIDQFLDLGSGIPTASNVHEVAQGVNPEARTVYVDSDAVAYAHGVALLADEPNARFVREDMRDPDAVLTDATVRGFLDFARPVGVLMFSSIPFVPDEDDPSAIVAQYRDATAPGSYLALTHGTGDYKPAEAGAISRVYDRASLTMTPRPRAAVLAMMAGYDLLDPGLTDAILWRPDPQAPPDPFGGDVTRYSLYAAVGTKP